MLTRSEKKAKEKIAYENTIEIIYIITGDQVKTRHNIMAMKKYEKDGTIPHYIEDAFGKKIYLREYGKKVLGGWEADHKLCQRLSGSNDISNLQALNWRDNILKSDNIDFLDKIVHYFFKSINGRVNYANNIRSLRKIKVGESYDVFYNSRVEHGQIGVVISKVISKSERYILVSFNRNKPIKVYADPELFYKMKSRRCRQR